MFVPVFGSALIHTNRDRVSEYSKDITLALGTLLVQAIEARNARVIRMVTRAILKSNNYGDIMWSTRLRSRADYIVDALVCTLHATTQSIVNERVLKLLSAECLGRVTVVDKEETSTTLSLLLSVWKEEQMGGMQPPPPPIVLTRNHATTALFSVKELTAKEVAVWVVQYLRAVSVVPRKMHQTALFAQILEAGYQFRVVNTKTAEQLITAANNRLNHCVVYVSPDKIIYMSSDYHRIENDVVFAGHVFDAIIREASKDNSSSIITKFLEAHKRRAMAKKSLEREKTSVATATSTSTSTAAAVEHGNEQIHSIGDTHNSVNHNDGVDAGVDAGVNNGNNHGDNAIHNPRKRMRREQHVIHKAITEAEEAAVKLHNALRQLKKIKRP